MFWGVALLAEGVDRNIETIRRHGRFVVVALLAEGVDRNACFPELGDPPSWVALLAEGVDRNVSIDYGTHNPCSVALLAEGVDRNNEMEKKLSAPQMSPSSRRAWIEIWPCFAACLRPAGRPPRGGRG